MNKKEQGIFTPDGIDNREAGDRKKESLEIELPENPQKYKETVGRLQKKLTEYENRLQSQKDAVDEYKAPEQISESFSKMDDTNLKIEILRTVLLRGRINGYELSLELSNLYKREGKIFDMPSFDKAFKVIKDYCETGGENVVGGTGF